MKNIRELRILIMIFHESDGANHGNYFNRTNITLKSLFLFFEIA